MSDGGSRADPVGQLAEEFMARYRRGERPALSEYTDRYPELADRLRDVLPMLVVMEEADSAGSAGDATGSSPAGMANRDGGRPGRIGGYRILREVGRGGMGVVYEAEQLALGRHVALKVLPEPIARDPRGLERFRREARAAARLHHTNIVPVHEVGQDGGVVFYAMQFIQGQPLDTVLEELKALRQQPGAARDPNAPAPEIAGTAAEVARSLLIGPFDVGPADAPDGDPEATATVAMPLDSDTSAVSAAVLPGQSEHTATEARRRHYDRSVAQVGVQVAEALAYAHREGVIHRDIKPSNLLLDTEGRVWITDFGLAKTEGDGLTHTGDIIGTLRYMAPERFRGWSDPRSDVYSLGLTLYEMLLLRPAFTTVDRLELIRRITNEEPVRPRKVDPRITRDLETIILKAIDKEPARRYQTTSGLAADLRRFLDHEPIQARFVGPLERAWIWARRRPAIAGLLVLVALSSTAGLAGVLWQWREATAQRNQAVAARDLVREKAQFAYLSLARLNYERGQVACEQGEIGPGLLYLVESWRSAVKAGDPDWAHAARANLAAWERHFPRPRVVFFLEEGVPNGAFAFSPDRQTVLIGWMGGARRWDLVTGSPIGETMRHGDYWPVRVAFSRDGRTMLTAGGKVGTAKVWDAETGKQIGKTMHHDADVRALAFSPDGQSVLTGSSDGKGRLWDARTGKLVHELKHRARVWAVAFSPDGEMALTGSYDGTAQRWNARTGEAVGAPLEHGAEVNAVAFSPDSRSIVTGSWASDGTARLWDARTGEAVGKEMRHGGRVKAVAFSPDGWTVLTGSDDGRARLWDARTGEAVGKEMRHDAEVNAVGFSPDGQTVLTGSHDGTARLWDARTGEAVGAPLYHEGPIRSAAFSPDSRVVLTGSDDQSARLWEIVIRGMAVGIKQWRGDPVWVVAFSPDGPRVLTAGAGGSVQLWDFANGEPIGRPLEHEASIESVALSPDGQVILIVSVDFTAQLWRIAGGRRIGTPIRHEKRIQAAAFSPDGKSVITVSDDGTALLSNATNGQTDGAPLTHHIDSQVGSVAFTPDGKFVVIGGGDGWARFWDISTRQRVGPGVKPEGGLIRAMAFSPDGRKLLTGSHDRRARLWDVDTGRPIGSPMRGLGVIDSVAFGPDGKTVLIGGADGTAQRWHVSTGQRIGAAMKRGGRVRSSTFGPDGTSILIGSADGTAWLVTTADLPDDLPRVATRVEALTGLTLDDSGAVRALGSAEWLQRRGSGSAGTVSPVPIRLPRGAL